MRSPKYWCRPMCWCAPKLSRLDRSKLGWFDLRMKEEEIRLELRRNGGHRGKVSQEMLIWLNDFKRMEDHLDTLEAQKALMEDDPADVKLVHEVKFLTKNSSILLASYRSGAVDRNRMTEQFVSPMLVGKSAQSVLNQVCDYLTDPEIGIIGLYGEGGVGKTTILKNLNSLLVNNDMFVKIIWVTLSQGATIESVQDEIALQLGITLEKFGKFADGLFWTRSSLISKNLKNLEKCLFLLDDIWGEIWPKDYINGSHLLTDIGIPEQRTGSSCNYKVVLTTRSPRVCLQMGTHKEIRVSPLSFIEAWDLFVSRSGNQVLDPEIRHIAEDIVDECEGLPITVIAIAHAMREEVSTIAWIQALKDIRNTYDVDLLRFAYSHLKNERVQKCFLYCAFFPEDFKFEARELIQYWIAEELLCEDSIFASIDEGYQILKEITDANMLEPVMRGGDTWVRMHDLFRDLAVRIMTQELGFFVQVGQQLSVKANTKKVSLIRSQIHYLYFHDEMSATSELSTLLLRDNPLSKISDRRFLDQLGNLQVLDMSYTGIKKMPNSVYHLSKLRVLFLQYCTSLEELQSLEYCKELQFLNLRGTLIKELPPGMEKLIQLRSLDLSETVRLENIQEGLISSLSNLEELQMQGSLLCKLESPTIYNRLKEIKCLEKLAILTLSAVGFEDHLDTILYLQGHSLTSFSINVYGSAQDYHEDV